MNQTSKSKQTIHNCKTKKTPPKINSTHQHKNHIKLNHQPQADANTIKSHTLNQQLKQSQAIQFKIKTNQQINKIKDTKTTKQENQKTKA